MALGAPGRGELQTGRADHSAKWPRWRQAGQVISTSTIRHHQIAPRLILEIDIGERLPVVIADDIAGGLFLDGPGL